MTGIIGDSRWPKYHPNTTQRSPGHTYPPKNLVCCIPNAVSQTKWTPKEWNNTTKIRNTMEWYNWKCISLFKAVSQLNVYHLFTAKNADNDDNDKNNDNNKNNGL